MGVDGLASKAGEAASADGLAHGPGEAAEGDDFVLNFVAALEEVGAEDEEEGEEDILHGA